MSSTTYWAEIRPDPSVRRLVLLSGALLAAAGLMLLTVAGGTLALKCLLAFAWLLLTGFELARNGIAYSRKGLLRVEAGGQVRIQGPDGAWTAAHLTAGSIVLPRYAWLRVSAVDGSRYGELVRGDARESEDWRRFQVIWRHIGASR